MRVYLITLIIKHKVLFKNYCYEKKDIYYITDIENKNIGVFISATNKQASAHLQNSR